MQSKGLLWLRYFAFFLVIAVGTVFFAACDTDGSTRWPSFTVVYISNGGSGTMADSVHRFGATYELSPNVFTRSGHNFDGWARTSGGSREFNDRQNVRNLTDTDGGIVRLYARWVSVTQQPGNITWTATATGSPTTTAISFTFSAAPTGLVASDITITSGTGSATRGALTGTGTTRSLAISNVSAGTVSVSINRSGIASGPQTVTLIGMDDGRPQQPGPTATLAAHLSWLQDNAQSGGTYTIHLNGGTETISSQTLNFSGRNNINIILTGAARRNINLSGTGSLFNVGSDVTLTLGNNITLRGTTTNNAPLINVQVGGTLFMDAGAVVTGNTNQGDGYPEGGGVMVSGTFTMRGGEISDNSTTGNASISGGGVFVGGLFIMEGGTISGNTASSSADGSSGGGVFLGSYGTGGTFHLRGGTISGNTAAGNTWSHGGGVAVCGWHPGGGTLLMSNGTIHGNNATAGLANTVSGAWADAAALSVSEENAASAIAQYGTFNLAGNFTRSGDLGSSDSTVHVINGVLQGDATPPPIDITWTATAAGTPTTTAINFTFSAAPTGLVASDITITSGTGSATPGTLSGTGTTRTLTVFNVTAGTVSVSINRSGIASGPQTVTLVADVSLPPPGDITWTATATGTPATTAINFTFSEDPGALISSDFTITSGTGSATVGILSGTGMTRTLTVFNVIAGTVSVSINWSNIAAGPQTVTLIAPAQVQPITITVTWIHSRYWWGNGSMTLFYPGTTTVADFFATQVTGASAGFTFTAAPGVYDIVLILEDWIGDVAYWRETVNVTAGTNTMSFDSFDFVMFLSEDIDPSDLTPPGRSRSGELDVQQMDRLNDALDQILPRRSRERVHRR